MPAAHRYRDRFDIALSANRARHAGRYRVPRPETHRPKMLYSSQASSIGIQPPRTASMTAALRRTVQRWPGEGRSGTWSNVSGCTVISPTVAAATIGGVTFRIDYRL